MHTRTWIVLQYISIQNKEILWEQMLNPDQILQNHIAKPKFIMCWQVLSGCNYNAKKTKFSLKSTSNLTLSSSIRSLYFFSQTRDCRARYTQRSILEESKLCTCIWKGIESWIISLFPVLNRIWMNGLMWKGGGYLHNITKTFSVWGWKIFFTW